MPAGGYCRECYREYTRNRYRARKAEQMEAETAIAEVKAEEVAAALPDGWDPEDPTQWPGTYPDWPASAQEYWWENFGKAQYELQQKDSRYSRD